MTETFRVGQRVVANSTSNPDMSGFFGHVTQVNTTIYPVEDDADHPHVVVFVQFVGCKSDAPNRDSLDALLGVPFPMFPGELDFID